jgi:predicted nuclease of predicted toxin-antitoxin system
MQKKSNRFARQKLFDHERTFEKRSIWELAIDEARIVVSKDEDFFILATRPHSEGRLLWLRMGNCRTIDLISSLNRRWEFIDQAFADQQRIVEVR